jgi:glutathionylspermidine synthase
VIEPAWQIVLGNPKFLKHLGVALGDSGPLTPHAKFPHASEQHCIVSTWIVSGESAGIGVRLVDSTTSLEQFVPHIIQ